MITIEEAKNILLYQIEALGLESKVVEHVPLWEAGGRILAEDIFAKEDVPSFDRSPVDGFALMASDTENASANKPIRLKVIDTIAAGEVSSKKITTGQTMRIFTGGALPEGATSIIKEEEVIKTDTNEIHIRRKLANGEAIALKGEDISKGEFLLAKGTTLHSLHMGLLATIGMNMVPVFKKLKIGVFSTGSELVEVGEELKRGQLRVSNTYTLSEIIREAGATPVNLGIVKDRMEDVLTVYEKAKQLKLPLVISTGGTATGDFDLIKEAMDSVSSKRLFNKVAMRPGAPAVVSTRENQLVIGLSGNPAGATVAMYILIYPLISKLVCGVEKELEQSEARLTKPLIRKGGLYGFLWANYVERDGTLFVTPFENQFCGALKTFSKSNCLIEVPAGKLNLPSGELVKIRKLDKK